MSQFKGQDFTTIEELVSYNKLKEALDLAKELHTKFKEENNKVLTKVALAKIYFIQGSMYRQNNHLNHAAKAFGMAYSFFLETDSYNESKYARDLQIQCLLELGREFSAKKEFERAAMLFEEASIYLKERNLLKSLETRAKALVFRAASVNDQTLRYDFLSNAADMFRFSGIDNPLVLGHVEYYSALANKLVDKRKALLHIERAIKQYKKVDAMKLIDNLRDLQIKLMNELV